MLLGQECHTCSSDCAQCGPKSPLECTACRDPALFLLEGSCIDMCPDGYEAMEEHQADLAKSCEPILSFDTADSATDILTISTIGVLQHQHPLTLLGHFPVLLLLLVPTLCIRRCQETGRTALSSNETLLVTLSSLEHVAVVLLLAKCAVGAAVLSAHYAEIAEYDSALEVQLLAEGNPSTDTLLVLGLACCVILVINWVINEWFYRALLRVWEDSVKEDFHEELSPAKVGCLCHFRTLRVLRCLNFIEWISLWKKRGWIIPRGCSLVGDHFCYLFVTFAKRAAAYNCLVKQAAVLYFLFRVFKTEPKAVFIGGAEAEIGPHIAYSKYVQVVKQVNFLIVNALLELALLGLSGNLLLQDWLLKGSIMKIEASWEPDSDSDESADLEEPEDSQRDASSEIVDNSEMGKSEVESRPEEWIEHTRRQSFTNVEDSQAQPLRGSLAACAAPRGQVEGLEFNSNTMASEFREGAQLEQVQLQFAAPDSINFGPTDVTGKSIMGQNKEAARDGATEVVEKDQG